MSALITRHRLAVTVHAGAAALTVLAVLVATWALATGPDVLGPIQCLGGV